MDSEAGFADFVEQWSPALMRVAFLLTGDRWSAEDLLQTALLKTSRRCGRLGDRDAAYAYVRRRTVLHTGRRRPRTAAQCGAVVVGS